MANIVVRPAAAACDAPAAASLFLTPAVRPRRLLLLPLSAASERWERPRAADGRRRWSGCDHKTVAHWITVWEATGGAPPAPAMHRRPVTATFQAKANELVDR